MRACERPEEFERSDIFGGIEVLSTARYPGVVALTNSAGKAAAVTLINKRWVLTTAHCPQPTTVLFNCLDRARALGRHSAVATHLRRADAIAVCAQASFGPVEATTRLAAHALASFLLQQAR